MRYEGDSATAEDSAGGMPGRTDPCLLHKTWMGAEGVVVERGGTLMASEGLTVMVTACDRSCDTSTWNGDGKAMRVSAHTRCSQRPVVASAPVLGPSLGLSSGLPGAGRRT